MNAEDSLATGAPIFVIGSPRSGTTLVRVILDSHRAISCGPESHFLADLIRLADAHWRQVERFGFDRSWWDAQVRGVFESVHLGYMKRRGRRRWADKTPGYALHLDAIDRLFPDACYLHVIRDGRDVVASHKDRWGYRSAAAATKQWGDHVGAARAFGRGDARTRYHEIRYEHLVESPEPVLRGAFEFLGERWDPEVLRFDRNPHDIERYDAFTASRRAESGDDAAIYRSRIGTGGEALDPVLRRLLRARSGRLMDELGYR